MNQQGFGAAKKNLFSNNFGNSQQQQLGHRSAVNMNYQSTRLPAREPDPMMKTPEVC